jgi:hypothetical protein
MVGMDPHGDTIPAVRGRAARFTNNARQAQISKSYVAPVYDKLEDFGEDVFAELRLVRDP